MLALAQKHDTTAAIQYPTAQRNTTVYDNSVAVGHDMDDMVVLYEGSVVSFGQKASVTWVHH